MVKSQMKTKVSCGICSTQRVLTEYPLQNPRRYGKMHLSEALVILPDFALQAYPVGNFRLEGESAGVQDGVVEVTKEYALTNFGWKSTILVGSYKRTKLGLGRILQEGFK